jgi:hypothetical protein
MRFSVFFYFLFIFIYTSIFISISISISIYTTYKGINLFWYNQSEPLNADNQTTQSAPMLSATQHSNPARIICKPPISQRFIRKMLPIYLETLLTPCALFPSTFLMAAVLGVPQLICAPTLHHVAHPPLSSLRLSSPWQSLQVWTAALRWVLHGDLDDRGAPTAGLPLSNRHSGCTEVWTAQSDSSAW